MKYFVILWAGALITGLSACSPIVSDETAKFMSERYANHSCYKSREWGVQADVVLSRHAPDLWFERQMLRCSGRFGD